MQIEFAASRPSGDYALVIPSAGGTRPGVDSAADKAAIEGALKHQRFEGDSGSAVEVFIDDGGKSRRLLVVGTGNDSLPSGSAEKLGGTTAGRL